MIRLLELALALVWAMLVACTSRHPQPDGGTCLKYCASCECAHD